MKSYVMGRLTDRRLLQEDLLATFWHLFHVWQLTSRNILVLAAISGVQLSCSYGELADKPIESVHGVCHSRTAENEVTDKP